MRNIWFILLTIVLLCSACHERVVYTTFYSQPLEGWHQDSALTYTAEIADSTALYDMLIVVRHNGEYPYQNLWLFVDVQKDSILLRRDTIESYLANERGEWYGSGMSKYTLPLLYMENIALPAGEYKITVQQGMREEQLRGITDVGLKVINN